MYTPDFVFVGLDGKKIRKDEYISSGKEATAKESREQVEASGGKVLPVAEKDRFWKPERYELNGKDEIIVYSYPISKQKQMLPTRPDGSAMTLAEVKTLVTQKEVYQRRESFLFLKRREIVTATIYINGKKQPKEVAEGKQLPIF